MDTEKYSNKVILAPMVRAGQLPLRVLALKYGADLVYTEEIVDKRLLECKRIENTQNGTVDYCVPGESSCLQICPSVEGKRVIFQMGTNEADRALEVAKFVENDVGGIDVNMGCPKSFSMHCGMGAALLKETDKVKQILTQLCQGCVVPVTCKIRVLDSLSDTLALAKEIEKCGVSALAVHGRRISERPSHSNRNDEIREVARALNIPVIANGGSSQISCYEDIDKFRRDCGCSSVMLARGALTSPSIFRKEGSLPMEHDIANFLDVAIDYESNSHNTKYVLQRILGGEQEHGRGKKTVLATTMREICVAWDKQERFDKMVTDRRRAELKRRYDESAGVEFWDITFPPRRLSAKRKRAAGMDGTSPKDVLYTYYLQQNLQKPSYECIFRPSDKRYTAVVTVDDGRKFSSIVGQPNKKMAEQVSALVALHGLGIRHLLSGDWEE